jgi:hypothetical protein
MRIDKGFHPLPITHSVLWGMYRVPLYRDRAYDTYTVFISDNYLRHYTGDTLPDFIKEKLAMIHATPNLGIHEDMEINGLNLMLNSYQPKLDEIGWQASDSWFVIILTTQELASMQGQKNGDDS